MEVLRDPGEYDEEDADRVLRETDLLGPDEDVPTALAEMEWRKGDLGGRDGADGSQSSTISESYDDPLSVARALHIRGKRNG